MPSRTGFEGKIFKILNKTKCTELGLDMPELSKATRRHLVLVVDWASREKRTVKCMTITSNADLTIGEYLPISPNPNPKNKYPMQIQLEHGPEQYYADGTCGPKAIQLPKLSFVKIDEWFEIPLTALYPAVNEDGHPFMIKRKKMGGLGHLRDYLIKREAELARVKACKDFEKSKLKDDVEGNGRSTNSDGRPAVREINELEPNGMVKEDDSWQTTKGQGREILQDFVQWASGNDNINDLPWESILESYSRYKGAELQRFSVNLFFAFLKLEAFCNSLQE